MAVVPVAAADAATVAEGGVVSAASGRTVLVTGGAGYIGSHIVWALIDRGDRPVVLDDLSTGSDRFLPPGVALVRGDVGDRLLLASVLKGYRPDAVVHMAAKVVVPDSVADPLGYYQTNVCKARTLIAACRAAGIGALVFSSSAAVYGMAETSPTPENTPTLPINPYGTSKLMVEWMLRDTAAASAGAFRYAALRYFNVAGADPLGRTGQATPGATHLIKVACEAALGVRPVLPIYGSDYATPDGTCVRDYIHVADLAQAHLLVLDHLTGGGASRVWNCGYGHGASVRQVVDAVERATGRPLPVKAAPRRAGDPPHLVADAARLRADLSWTPRHDDLDAIVRSALDWETRLREGS